MHLLPGRTSHCSFKSAPSWTLTVLAATADLPAPSPSIISFWILTTVCKNFFFLALFFETDTTHV